MTVRFGHGDLLTARDLAADAAASERAHALHARALHAAPGIALGYQVGRTFDRDGLVVGPGYAYDCRGRAVVSGRTVVVPAPETLGMYDLVLDGDCGRARLRWVAAGLARRDELFLARLAYRLDPNGTPELGEPDVSPRRHVRPPQAAMRAGRARVTAEWSSLEATLSVPTGGFDDVPYYFAHVDTSFPGELIGPFLEVVQPDTSGFELVVRFASRAWRDTSAARTTLAATTSVDVGWIAVERPPRSAAAFDLAGIDVGDVKHFAKFPPDPDPTRT